MDDLNDIRMALGAITTRLNDLHEKVDRLQRLADVGEYLDQLADELPTLTEDLISRLESDPMLGVMVAPILAPTLRGIAAGHTKRRELAST